jgi:TonB family protein
MFHPSALPVMSKLIYTLLILLTTILLTFCGSSKEINDEGYIPVAYGKKKTSDSTIVYKPVDSPPQIIGGIERYFSYLTYPEEARRQRLQGQVEIECMVMENGKIKDVKVVKSAGFILDEAAIDALRRVKFKPGYQNGAPVAVKYTIPVNFHLKEGDWNN